MRGPRRKLLTEVDGLTVWRVDGHRIRDRVDIEFTNGAHHHMAPYVPPGEIWIDREAPGAGDEWRLWTTYQLVHHERMAAGATYLEALASAERAERKARGLVRGPRRAREVRALALRSQIGAVSGRKVFLVRGRVVRDHAYVHFTQGGHHHRYRFIPRDEIWIDDAVAPAERAAVIHHELVELLLMEDQGMSYPDAHRRASAAEVALRRRGLMRGRLG